MLRFLISFVICFSSIAASAEVVHRKPGEDTVRFIAREGLAESEFTHVVIETKEWKFKDDIIIAFYERAFIDSKTDNTYSVITGFVFIPITDRQYQKIEIDSYGPEGGGDPNIETVLFADTDKGPDKKLILIVSRPQKQSGVSGTLYSTYVYAKPALKPALQKLAYLKDVSKKLSGDCECVWADGRKKRAKFKTASDITAELKQWLR
ncbi:MAG: hypothetical protein V4568_11260 [Pseudomonadota bacterium]